VSDGTVYVYGVVDAADAGAMPVRTVLEGGLAALVADVAPGSVQAAKAVREHWRVLDAAVESATVLPLRFGTVMSDDQAVREELLGPNAEHLAELLADLRGRVQVTVKGTYVDDGLMRGVVAGSPAVKALRERLKGLPEEASYFERVRLGELVAAEVERHREAETARALAELDPHAVGSRAEAASGPDAAFNLAFLVERERLGAFDEAVGALAGELGGRIAVRGIGPLAPYSFADAELAAGAA
jgi:Gas vesicle synthesis protein GvpL/GvpF